MLSLRALSKSRALPNPRLFHSSRSARNDFEPFSPRHRVPQGTSSHHVASLVVAANNGNFAQALKTAQSMAENGIALDIKAYDALMTCAAKDACWLFAWNIFDDMVKSGIKPNASIFASLISAQRARPYANAWAALDKMKEFGVKPTTAVYSALITTQAESYNTETVVSLYCEMRRAGIIPELDTIQAIITNSVSSGLSQLAFDIATQYEKDSKRILPAHAWTKILACAASNLDYNVTKSVWKHVFHTLDEKVTEFVALAVLNTASRASDAALATETLEALREIAVPWQEFHFAAILEALCKSRKIKEAFVTLQLMKEEGLQPTEASYGTISEFLCADVDNLEIAWAAIDEIWAEMPTHLDIAALKAVMKAAITLGDLQRAVAVYRSFDDYSITRDIATYNMLIDSAIGASHRQLGDVILADMKDAKVTPDIETYEKIIQLCLTQDTYEDAFFYLEEMKAADHIPPRSLYEAILAKCVSMADTRGSLVQQEMEECGYKPQDTRMKMAVRHTAARNRSDRPRRSQGEGERFDQKD